MTTPRRALYVLALLFLLAPFGFGTLRYLQTGRDLRMLWMACASLVGAAIVFAIARGRVPVLRWTMITLVVTTGFAWATAIALGAVRGPGAWMVAVALAACFAASYALYARARASIDAAATAR